MFPTAVTECADVVLPVAAAPEKAGSYLDWEGRARSFDATLHGTGQLPDGRVLQGLADEMDVDLRLPTPEAARAELAALGTARRPGEGVGPRRRARRPRRRSPATRRCSPPGGSCSTPARCSATSRELAGTARPPVARHRRRTPPRRLGLADGDRLTVSGATGSVTLPVRITAMPDRVVWLPMRSPGSEIRTDLGTGPGGVVGCPPERRRCRDEPCWPRANQPTLADFGHDVWWIVLIKIVGIFVAAGRS